MNYTPETYEKARSILNEKKKEAERIATKKYNDFVKLCPEVKELERALAHTGSRATITVLKGGNVKEELTKLKEVNLNIQKKKEELLTKFGYTKNDITPNYSCKKCKDGGYVEGFMCSCLKDLLKKVCYDELNSNTPLEVSDFKHIDLNFYKCFSEDECKLMERIFEYCKNYAHNFTLQSPSLLFQGNTGLGKTHLSLAIANEVIKKGFGVIYGSVHNFALDIEKKRYDREDDISEVLSECDFLILDDMGTEFSSNYTQSIIYDIINTRIMKKLPTIISTNLTTEGLEKRYNTRLVSRLIGTYNRLGFTGKDIRQLKKFRT